MTRMWGLLGALIACLMVTAAQAGAEVVSAGGGHSCAVRAGGTVACWGYNSSGQLGNASNEPSRSPVEVAGISDALEVSAGGDHACAREASGAVRCWGRNEFGQVGDGTTDGRNVSVATNINDAVAVDAGHDHSCAVRAGGAVLCWGDNAQGQLGGSTQDEEHAPVVVSGVSDAVAVSAGDGHTCAVRRTGGILCWGSNTWGQLGNGTRSGSPTPVAVFGVSDAVAVSAGDWHTCAVRRTGAVICWGDSTRGQIGADGGTGVSTTPVTVPGVEDAVAVGAGIEYSCALRRGGTVLCWGNNDFGQLGDGLTRSSRAAVAVAGLDDAAAVSAGGRFSGNRESHACAVRRSGRVVCWGDNGTGQLGDGSPERRSSTAVAVSGLAGVEVVSAGGGHSCALKPSGQVLCWGDNQYCQLGDGSWVTSPMPVAVPGVSDAVAVSAGLRHSCAVRGADGQVWCWGENFFGQLGDNSHNSSSGPVRVAGVSGAVAVSAGEASTCATLTDGSVVCWGNNDYGQLGNNTTTSSSVPVTVSGMSAVSYGADIETLSVGAEHACAVDVSTGVRCWGHNEDGRLGDNTLSDRHTPVAAGSLASVMEVGAGDTHSCARTVGGAVYCWGDNGYGQLGDGTTVPAAFPIASGVTTDAVSLGVGRRSTCAVRSGGSVACWGDNARGQLGSGTTGSSTPAPVSAVADAQTVSVGDEHACAVRAGGAVVCWGSTADGRLGDGFAPEGHYAVMRTPVGVAGLNDAVVPDLVGPVIEIGRPADGEVFALGAVVDSAFTCTDPGSGVAACDGPARVDTSSAGEHTFTVNAVDALGNRSSRSVRYTVQAPAAPTPGAPAPGTSTPTDRGGAGRIVPAPVVRVTAAAGTRLRVSLRATLWREVAGRAVRIQVRRGARWVPVGTTRVTPTGRIVTRLVVTRAKLGGMRVRTARLRLVLVRTATAPAMVGRARAVRVPPMRRVVGR